MSDPQWWRDAVIYQIYPRSFADGDGDGIGDVAGIRSRLPYLADLGIEAVWLSPWYPSPMADAGYDVADYRDIDPVFGTLADAEAFIADAHRLGIRVIIDVVPNHCSTQHRWFREALAAGPGSPQRQRFWFRPGRGPDGGEPPNDWTSIFGGPAWTRVEEADGSPGEWYLHLFASEQPDFNWGHPDIHDEFRDVLRFWFDRGVDGIRVDSAALCAKHPDLPDGGGHPDPLFTDRDDVHDVYRDWRAIADGYPGGRVLIGEVWLPDAERFARYLRDGELHTAFNFDFLGCPWEPAALRRVIDNTLRVHEPVGAPATWVLSNHDVTRHVTRYGRSQTSFSMATRQANVPTDIALGTRRARAAALLSLALPGSAYIYQGEELGLWEVDDIPPELKQDPMWLRSGGENPGRDGCRVPLPWAGDAPPFAFGPDGSTPWLPQPAAWREYTVDAQRDDPGSMLALYRTALRIRATLPASKGTLDWIDAPDGVLAFHRAGLTCVVNLSRTAHPIGAGTVALASGPTPDGALPPDTAVWLT